LSSPSEVASVRSCPVPRRAVSVLSCWRSDARVAGRELCKKAKRPRIPKGYAASKVPLRLCSTERSSRWILGLGTEIGVMASIDLTEENCGRGVRGRRDRCHQRDMCRGHGTGHGNGKSLHTQQTCGGQTQVRSPGPSTQASTRLRACESDARCGPGINHGCLPSVRSVGRLDVRYTLPGVRVTLANEPWRAQRGFKTSGPDVTGSLRCEPVRPKLRRLPAEEQLAEK
jgi:hypothetical protein